MKRRLFIAGAVALVGVAAVAALLGPRYARSRVEELLVERSGCEVTIDGLDLGLRTIELVGVHAQCSYGAAELDRVELDVSWIGRSVSAIRARGGRVALTSRPERVARGEGRGEGLARRRPDVALDDVDVSIADEAGPIAEATLSLRLVGGARLTLEARRVATSERLHPQLRSASIEATLDLDARVVLDATLDELVVEPNGGDALEETVRAWLGRSSSRPADARGGAHRHVWELLAEGARVRVTHGAVHDADGAALTGLEIELARIAGSRLRTVGSGEPRGAGVLRWNLRIDAEGGEADGPVELENVPLGVITPFLPPLPLDPRADARVSAALSVRTEAARVDFDGRVNVTGLGLESPRIASAPVDGIAFSLEGRGAYERSEHVLTLDRGILRMGRAQATLSGRALLSEERFAIDLSARLVDGPCEDAVHAIPAGLLQGLEELHLDGRLGASVTLSVDSARLDDTALRFSIDDRCRFVATPALADLDRFRQPFRHEVLEPDGSLFSMVTGPGTDAWSSIDAISPFLVHAVLAHEDASFLTHRGFAPWAIRDALIRNLRERRYVLGASTITMQLVKNVFLRREKTLARKIQEVLLTWWIERSWNKTQILELYLNVIEYGPSIYGIRSAAQHYFGRDPADLSAAEAAYLAMILPNPPSFHEQWERGSISPSFRRRLASFVGLLEQRGRIDADAAEAARAELERFAFSRAGERVGPEVTAGSWAPLPIEGLRAPGEAFSPDAPGDDDATRAREDDGSPEGWEGWSE